MDEWRSALEFLSATVRRFFDLHIRVLTIVLCLIAVPLALAYLTPTGLGVFAPSLESIELQSNSPTDFVFLDVKGNVIGHLGTIAGERLQLEEMPGYLPAAFIAMEDRRFYAHNGVDLIGLSRAAYANLRARHVVAGGSTISQQTAKILYSGHERTWSRKARELLKATALEHNLSKKQILELYLNHLYLGDGAYGVDTAARTYFGVSARHVSLPQAAMLAALTRAPTVFSPRRDLRIAQQRAGLVLTTMVNAGFITPEQAAVARARPAGVIARRPDTHGYFLDAAADEARKLVAAQDIRSGELVVRTNLDSNIQQTAEAAAANAVQKYGRKMNFSQVALVVMTPDGAVSAMVGGLSYQSSVFNRITQAHRQPGSAFKPFVYLAALEKGISPWDWRDDRPVDIAGYQPANYRDTSYGTLRLADALARSVNTITVSLAQEVGIANVSAAARRAGIVSPLQDNASLALGTNEVTPLELTAAYATFANSGHLIKPFLVTRIDTARGAVVYQHTNDTTEPVIADSVRRDMVTMLHKVVTSGTGMAASLGVREAAGKTGTTQDYRDAWFVGFTTDYVTGVWVGNDANTPMHRVTGGAIPAQIWKAVMTAAERDYPILPLDRSQEPPLDVEDALMNTQPDYVDDAETWKSDLPMDSRGNFIALSSGVSSRGAEIARVAPPPPETERNSLAPPSPSAGGEDQAIVPGPLPNSPRIVSGASYQAYPQNNRGTDLPAVRDLSPPSSNPPISGGQSDALIGAP